MSFAKTIVVGNLGADPELRYTPEGTPVASFSVCANTRRKDRAGNRVEEQQWYKANVFGNSAEAVAKHLAKGDQVYVEGRLKPELWKGRDGETRLTLGLYSSDVQFIGTRNRRDESAGASTPDTSGQSVDGSVDGELVDDGIPF